MIQEIDLICLNEESKQEKYWSNSYIEEEPL